MHLPISNDALEHATMIPIRMSILLGQKFRTQQTGGKNRFEPEESRRNENIPQFTPLLSLVRGAKGD